MSTDATVQTSLGYAALAVKRQVVPFPTSKEAAALQTPSEPLQDELVRTPGLPSPNTVRRAWARAHAPPPGFNAGLIQKFLDHDNHQMRADLRQFLSDPLFSPPRLNLSLEDERELALQRLEALCRPGPNGPRFISIWDFLSNPHRIFAAHEIVGMASGSLATKMTVQFNLAGGTILKLGTERHHRDVIDRMDTAELIGCFALTELNFGNNAVMMETTATFDKRTDEFIINTPNQGAAKYWITNSAVHAHIAVVFAQLITGGENYGVHAFVVPLRDLDTHAILPGISIIDMRGKMGCNGVDNGALAFSAVRVPRSAMLDAHSTVSTDGVFTPRTPAVTGAGSSARRARFLRVADQLLSGRLCISSMMLGSAKQTLTLAVRYSASRLAAGPSGASDVPLLGLQLQQRALAPLFARLFASNAACNYAKDRYWELQRGQHGEEEDVWREAVVLCCAVKPMVCWTAERVASVCRERCGGGGYLAANRFGDALGFAHAGITAEGDAAVLMQKAAKELLVLVAQGRHVVPRVRARPTLEEVHGIGDAYIAWLLAQREAVLVKELGDKTRAVGRGGGNRAKEALFSLWMEKEADLVQDTAMAFVEATAYEKLTEALEQEDEAGMELVRRVYGLDTVFRSSGWYASRGLFHRPSQVEEVHKALCAACAKLGPVLPYYVDAFGIPEHLLDAPIAGNWLDASFPAEKLGSSAARSKL